MNENEIPVIGTYPLTNAGGILVHKINFGDDMVLASMNGETPQWCGMEERETEGTEDLEPGFCYGSIFVPFSKVMRL